MNNENSAGHVRAASRNIRIKNGTFAHSNENLGGYIIRTVYVAGLENYTIFRTIHLIFKCLKVGNVDVF